MALVFDIPKIHVSPCLVESGRPVEWEGTRNSTSLACQMRGTRLVHQSINCLSTRPVASRIENAYSSQARRITHRRQMPSSLNDLASSLHPTTQSPALPWEVIERAIDHCSGDKTTLCTLALTCSQLHPCSLFVLFTNVDIQIQEQLKKFYDAVQAQPHLQPLVRSLSFPWDKFSVFPLLSILPGLRHVAFKGDILVFRVGSQLLQPDLQLVTSVRSLTIRSAGFQT
ncbi:hypothetical protein BD309DRAFT_277080 [Dichomitus squalens]|uniref:Uncharacterized protein n=1 Tax=Dichomitus squalens TaxID=114155 RepID=A0A4Q9PRN4_9APHY|nr:hypothetical protein BD309DRAFT_277080 [Dichomitus squalens]TBU57046.1 hypothetical protein BD310DRAFT_572507 [Dichomitus squalens]